MKVIINRCYGGFSVSEKALKEFLRVKQIKIEKPIHYDSGRIMGYRDELGTNWTLYTLEDYRTDFDLIRIVEEMGTEANGDLASLKIVEIPNDVEWEIEDYDGIEAIHEVHRVWS